MNPQTSKTVWPLLLLVLLTTNVLGQNQPTGCEENLKLVSDSIKTLKASDRAGREMLLKKDLELVQLNSNIESLQKVILLFRDANAKLTAEADLLRKEKDALKSGVSELQLKVATVEKQNADLELNRNKLLQQLAEQNQATEAVRTRLKEEETKLKTEQQEKQRALQNANSRAQKIQNLNVAIASLEAQRIETQREKAKLDSTVQADQKAILALRIRNAELGKAGVLYKWLIIGLVIVFIGISLYPIWNLYLRFRYSEQERKEIDKFADDYIRDTLREYFYFKKAIRLLRKSLFMLLGVTACFVFILVAFNLTDESFTIQKLIEDNFLRIIGGVTVPLGFVITLYANAESKRNELSKFIIEKIVKH